MAIEKEKTVLVVEDDEAIANLVRKALEHAGFRVVTQRDGEAALVSCVEERPKVIILDVNLPKLDGFTVARRIKAVASLKHIPIIFTTALDRAADKISGIQAGAKHYLTKPFKVEDLVSKVSKLIEESH